MRKFLSVLLAVMMVVSTVSFAAPSAVTTDDNATNAVAEDATQATTENEEAELTAESDYGTLVYSVDFERSDFDVTKFSTAYAMLASNPIAAYLNPDFNYSNVTTYTDAAGDGFSNAALVTENGNTYIQGSVTIDNSVYDGFFRMSKYTNPWPKGQYTFSVDVKVPAGQADGFTAQCNNTDIALTTISAFDTTKGDWQTVVYQTTNVVSGDNAVDGGIYGFFVTPKNVSDGTVAYDNWKVYYKADSATVTIDPNGRAGKTAVDVEGLTANSNVSVATLLAKAQEMDSAVIGLATEPAGAVINTSTHYVEYYDRLYAVYGFDVTIANNGNSAVSNVAVNDVDTRNGITVSELVSRINNTSSKILRGISNTATGEPLADSYVVKSDSDVTLYMIWEADGSEYGTLLASIDFEDIAAGTVLTDNAKVELVDPDALTNGEFLINWQVGGNTVAQEANSNKYVRGGQGWAQFIFNNPKYNDANAPMPEGKYTILANVIDFGTTKRSISTTCQSYGGVSSGTANSLLDSFTGENNKWDLVVGQWNGSSNDMTIYFTDNPATDVGFDNIRLYFEPASNAVFSITVDPNGRTDASSKVAKVNNGSTITAGELASLMPGCAGVSLTVGGEALSSDYIISPDYNKTVYAVWEYEESEFGTLLFQIDFEKDGISLPADKSTIPVKDIATIHNKDLVFGDNILLSTGKQSGSNPLDNREIVEENGNKYFRADFSDSEDYEYYTFFSIFEQESNVDWMDGTYTLVADFKTDKTYTGFSYQVNNKSENVDTNLSVLDKETDNVDVWDTVAIQYAGAISTIDYGYGPTGSLYFAPRISSKNSYVAGKISVDNIKLFFKTDETVITLKPNGNSDISDIKVPVSTSTGITVAELIEVANQYPTTHTLLGISDSGSGELLAEDTIIKPSYQETYYLIWQTAANDPTISMQYGKLLFNIDFEKDSLLESGWDGQLSLDNNDYTSGSFPSYIASYYDEDVFTGKNFRIKFLTSDTETNASIKTDASGNNYLSGTPSTQWPQIVISNYDELNIGAGYYTVFFDSYSKTGMTASMRIDKPTGSTILEGGNAGNTAFSVPNDEWKSYSFKFELAEDDIMFPNTVVNYSLEPSDKNSATVGWDDLKVYFKPYEATVTILPGDYEEFGKTTITGIDTTTATTLETVISSMMADINNSGRGFAGLMDHYGEMVDLTKSVIIPCDMTYTIVWEEENEYAPVTWKSNSIRHSTKVNSRGIRFAADANPTYALDSKTTEYGWVIARTDVLENAGIRATSLTKETFNGDPKKVIVGKNFGEGVTGGGADGRKHFYQDDENIVITAVIYGVPEKYYGYAFTVRPYIVYDGVTYYGKPWSRSMFDTALSIKNGGYEACGDDQDLIDYVNDIINTVLENSNDIEFDYGEL